MPELQSFSEWSKSKNLNEESAPDIHDDEDLAIQPVKDVHSQEALHQYKTGINNNITLAAEDENGVYKGYIERMLARLERHQKIYQDHVKGSVNTEEFIRDIELTQHLMQDWDAYMKRFVKVAESNKKKNDK